MEKYRRKVVAVIIIWSIHLISLGLRRQIKNLSYSGVLQVLHHITDYLDEWLTKIEAIKNLIFHLIQVFVELLYEIVRRHAGSMHTTSSMKPFFGVCGLVARPMAPETVGESWPAVCVLAHTLWNSRPWSLKHTTLAPLSRHAPFRQSCWRSFARSEKYIHYWLEILIFIVSVQRYFHNYLTVDK